MSNLPVAMLVHRRYRVTRNPLALWAAYAYARKHKHKELAPEILDYFDRCAAALLAKSKYDLKGTADAHIAKCMELKPSGPPNMFRRMADYIRDLEIEDDVHLRGKTRTAAAADRNRQESEVRRKRAMRRRGETARKRKPRSA